MKLTTALAVMMCAGASLAAGSERLIHVDGEALVEAKPDYAVVRLNLEARDRLLKRARAAHEADVASVLQIASKYKVAAADIAQDFPEVENRGDGFMIRRTIQLTVRSLSTYDAMLFELYESAALAVDSVEFRVANLRAQRDSVRAMALRAAESKVRMLASVMNRRVGRVMDVRVETGGGTLVRRRGQPVFDDRASASQNVAFSAGGGAMSAGAELFRVPVTAKVSVQYEILD